MTSSAIVGVALIIPYIIGTIILSGRGFDGVSGPRQSQSRPLARPKTPRHPRLAYASLPPVAMVSAGQLDDHNRQMQPPSVVAIPGLRPSPLSFQDGPSGYCVTEGPTLARPHTPALLRHGQPQGIAPTVTASAPQALLRHGQPQGIAPTVTASAPQGVITNMGNHKGLPLRAPRRRVV